MDNSNSTRIQAAITFLFLTIALALTFLFFVFAIVMPVARAQEKGFKLHSPAFSYFGNLPLRYTCTGLNVSPPLGWTNVPKGCKSLALVLINSDDSTVHWLVWNIDPALRELREGVDISSIGAITGRNDCGTLKYEGPCSGEEIARYSVVLYALKEPLTLKEGADKKLFYAAIARRVIEETSFVFFSGVIRVR